MNELKNQFVPILNSQAGSCLTHANWQNADVTFAAVDFSLLLMKPGLSVLQVQNNLNNYFSWPGKLVLNALCFFAETEENYTTKSIYDGSKISLSRLTFCELMTSFKTDYVILPAGSMNWFKRYGLQLPQDTFPFFAEEEQVDLPLGTYGHYIKINSTITPDKIEKIKQLNKPCYLIGDFEPRDLTALATLKHVLIETDLPAKHALQGLVYEDNHILNLLDSCYQEQFTPLTKNCQCPTCSTNLTRAYLHHLLQHTPLLAQRYLIQHNAYFYCHILQSHR